AFHARGRDPLHERFLRDEEEDDDRRDDEHAGGHEQVPGRAAMLRLIRLQAEAERELLGAQEEDERPEEIIPYAEERKERDDDERGFGEREHDAEEDAQFAAAVDAGGIGKLGGNREEELAEEKNGECLAEPRGDP